LGRRIVCQFRNWRSSTNSATNSTQRNSARAVVDWRASARRLGLSSSLTAHNKDAKDRLDFTEILANELWVGAAPTLADLEEIKKQSVGKAVIVDLTRNPWEEEWSKKLGLQYEDQTRKVEETLSAIPLRQLRLVSALIEQNISRRRHCYLH